MSPTRVWWRDHGFQMVSVIWMGIASVMILIGFLQLADQNARLKDEVIARAHGQCVSFAQTRNGERATIKFVLKPVDTTGLDPVRLQVVKDLNATRAEALDNLLKRLPPPPDCSKLKG